MIIRKSVCLVLSVTLLMLAACSSNGISLSDDSSKEEAYSNSEITVNDECGENDIIIPYSIDVSSNEMDITVLTETWQDSYALFLSSFLATEDIISYFSLWDFDNDVLPELIIYQYKSLIYGATQSLSVYSVYTYNGNIIKLGGLY